MKQGSTYPIIITVPGIDLSGADWIILSLKARMKPILEFTSDDMQIIFSDNSTTIRVALTQEQSLSLAGTIAVDLNWELDGIRSGCIPQTITMVDTLLKRVVEG